MEIAQLLPENRPDNDRGYHYAKVRHLSLCLQHTAVAKRANT